MVCNGPFLAIPSGCPQVGLTAVGIALERLIVTTQLPSFNEKPPEADSFCPA